MTGLLDRLAMLAEAATPGPWRWYGNTETRRIILATRGHGICTVMDFVRYGMSGAAPRFAVGRDWANDKWGGVMVRADELAQYEVLGGQTIAEAGEQPNLYRQDIVGLDHPDASLIVAAVNALPTLLLVARLAQELANEAASAVCEPRRFHENEDHRQQALGRAVTSVRAALASLGDTPT